MVPLFEPDTSWTGKVAYLFLDGLPDKLSCTAGSW
jgi:hypothetical protein